MIGRTLGKYKIVELLGQGGMAEVYKAYQANLDRYVAVKFIKTTIAESPESLARFEREAKSAAALRHPNIVQIHDYDVDPESGRPYMVMELIEGGSLADDLEQRAKSGTPLTLADTANIIGQVGAALGYAHRHGVIHRDVKPSNIMRDITGRLILTDFGLAKMTAETSVTESGASIGTPDYMSPEQVKGEPVDARSDLYALGVILFKLLTGQLPFRANTPTAVMLKHVTDPVPNPQTTRPDLPASLARVVTKSLAKSPDERYQTADEFLAEFQAALAEADRAFQPVSPVSPKAPAAPSSNVAVIRQLLIAAFDDGEIVTLCFDSFRPVYEKFGAEMSKATKIQLLLEHCERHQQLDVLLQAVAQLNPAQYQRFAPQLVPPAGITPTPPVAPARIAPESYAVRLEITPPPEPSLPPKVVEFVGRESELAGFADQLANKHLAVIIGMPGIGKTAMASELARQKERPTHTFWHSFHEGEGVSVLIWKLAAFLAWHDQSGLWNTLQGSTQPGSQLPPPEVLMDYLFQMVRGPGYLLCLDDFHWVDDDPLLEKFIERLLPTLEAGQADVIIATQRRPAFVLESDVTPLGGLTLADMRLLLAQRGLALSDEMIADLHASTDGNAQLVMLAVDTLRRSKEPSRVISRLCESEQIERFLVTRVDEGLSDEERSVMSAVAVLLGYSGTRDAIAAALDGASVRRPLNDLVSRSLITVVEGESGREYSLNAMVRAYYYDLLGKRERQAMHRRAGEFYETEEPDALRAALHFEAAGDLERAARLATADVLALINLGQAQALYHLLSRFGAKQLEVEPWARINIARGQICTFLRMSDPAKASFQAALLTLSNLPAGPATQELVARACRGMGSILEYEAPPEALEWLQRGLEELGPGNPEEEAALYIHIYKVHTAMGNYDAGLEAIQKGLSLLPEGPSPLRTNALLGLGTLYSSRGDIETGSQYTRQALEVAQQLHDYFQMVGIWYNLGFDRFDLNDWPGAAEYFRQALALAEKLGDVYRQANIKNMLGMLYTNLGDYDTANAHLSQAHTLARGNNLRSDLPYILGSLADMQLRQGKWDAAGISLDEAEQLALDTKAEYPLVYLYAYRAQVCLGKGQLDAALEMAERSCALAREMKLKTEQGNSLRVLGQVLQARGQTAEALDAFEKSLAWLASAPYEAARTKLQWGLALNSTGNTERGTALLQAARATFEQLGARRELAEVIAS